MKACESNPNQFMHDCCEKAREWDNLSLDKEDKDIALHGAKLIKQNQKLRDLIEKGNLPDITEEQFCGECWDTIRKELLTESKK